MESLSKVFPDRPVVDIEDRDQIFHVLYDLSERIQVPGVVTFGSGTTYEYDGVEAKWRGIYDDKGRIMVAICHNMDLGDAWEWADNPELPREVRLDSLPDRYQLHHLRDDPLMFEFFFKYPAAAFAKGELVLLGRWPVWLLASAIILAALLLALPYWRHRVSMPSA